MLKPLNSFQTAIYARISRDKKDKQSDYVEKQIAFCESYIKKNDGYNLVGIYKDILLNTKIFAGSILR